MSDRRPWTNDEIELLRRYFPTVPFTRQELEDTFGRSASSIYKKAKSLGLQREKPVHRYWTDAEICLLAEMYSDSKVSREAMEQAFGRNWESIESKAQERGFRRPHPTRIAIHRDYFRVIDTEEKAYWLGFLAADGSIQNRPGKHQVSLGLQAKDLYWLTKYRDTVAPDAAITDRRTGNFVVSVASKEMVQDLVGYGLIPNKAKTLRFPQAVTGSLAMPFILGYFDGDGNLYRYKFINTMTWSLLGTHDFLSVAREYLISYVGVKIQEPRRHKKFHAPHLFEIRVHGSRAEQVDRVLNASGLGLPRKHLPR